jgi:hypothetical protein
VLALEFQGMHCFSTHEHRTSLLNSWSHSSQLLLPSGRCVQLQNLTFILAKTFLILLIGSWPHLVFRSFQNHPEGKEAMVFLKKQCAQVLPSSVTHQYKHLVLCGPVFILNVVHCAQSNVKECHNVVVLGQQIYCLVHY